MSIHATAVYEKGVLKLDAPLELAESSRVSIEINLIRIIWQFRDPRGVAGACDRFARSGR